MSETEGVVWEEYHDRSAGLMIFGLVQMGLGVLAVLVCAFIAMGAIMSRNFAASGPTQGMPNFDQLLPTFILGAVVLVAVAALLVTLGAGSILARRWARVLSLAFWTTGLAYGVVALIMQIFLAPAFQTMMETSMKTGVPGGAGPSASAPPPEMASFMAIFMVVFSAVLFVGLPLPFVLFYRSKHVKATCEWRDSEASWTDNRPVPVLVASLLMLAMSLVGLQQSMSGSFYLGMTLKGMSGAVGAIIVAGVFLAAAIGLVLKRPWGWWTALIAMAIETTVWYYAAATGQTDVFNMKAFMGTNAGMLAAAPGFMARSMWSMATSYLILTGYLVWLRRYFRGDSAA